MNKVVQMKIETMFFSSSYKAFLCSNLAVCFIVFQICSADANPISTLAVDGSGGSGRRIPDTFFGAFFEANNF